MRNINVILTVPVLTLSLACNAPTAATVLDSGGKETQLQLRSMQSRVFDTTDREKTLRTIIATLQDLSFVIDKAELSGYNLRITVSVRPRGTTQLSVRANASFNDEPILDPKPYQDFFVSLEKAMFLTAQQVD
jgi:hypothetical protein